MGLDYIDLRLSMNDETDFKFPYLSDEEYNGEKIKVSNYAVPKWAYKANTRPTLVHFEELNRAPQFVRNAALQLLLERTIGPDFSFNDNVFMMATGNLGADDGTDVEELDNALNNRLIHYPHELTLDEWIEFYAKDKVHRNIVEYLRQYPDKFYVKPNENSKAYATPRSWTFLSDYIIKNYGKDSATSEWLMDLTLVGKAFIGNTYSDFMRYCEAQLKLTINDVLEDFDKVKKSLTDDFKRDKKSELIFTLKEMDVLSFNKKQLDNVIKFLAIVDQDERYGYLIDMTDKYDEDEFEPGRILHTLLSAFKDDVDRMTEENEKQIK